MKNNNTSMLVLGHQYQQGISLIEAMIALLIASLGMVGLIGIQLFLNVNSDVAKQRTEAMRLAQADMENLRVFRTTGVSSSSSLLWSNLVKNQSATTVTTGTGSNTYTSNATYSLDRVVSTASDLTQDKMKDVQVKVSWVDKKGDTQQVVLRSMIAGIDPSLAVSLSIIPNGSPVKDILGRNIQIPIPAKSIGGGKSVFKPRSNSNMVYVFDTKTGLISQICTIADSTKTNAQITQDYLDASACTDAEAYLVAGFVRFKNGSFNNQFDPRTANDPTPSGTTWSATITLNDAAPPAGKQGLLSLLSDSSTAWSTAISRQRYARNDGLTEGCFAENLRTISFTAAVSYTQENNGTTQTTTSTKVYLSVPVGLSLTAANIAPYTEYTSSQISDIDSEGEYYIGYSCIVYPIDLDNSSGTKNAWTGLVKLAVSGGTIGSGASAYKVCRFSADYNRNGYVWGPSSPSPASASGSDYVVKIDNDEHPYAYLNVQKSLSNQNYLVIAGNQNCPAGNSVEVDGTGSENYTDTTTVLHQP